MKGGQGDEESRGRVTRIHADKETVRHGEKGARSQGVKKKGSGQGDKRQGEDEKERK